MLSHCLWFLTRIMCLLTTSFCQTAAQLLSAAMIIYALTTTHHITTSAVLLQPWFIVLVVAGAVERLAGLALGVSMERDWVVLVITHFYFCCFLNQFFSCNYVYVMPYSSVKLAGTNRPVALAQANSMLSRIDLLCEVNNLLLLIISQTNSVIFFKGSSCYRSFEL